MANKATSSPDDSILALTRWKERLCAGCNDAYFMDYAEETHFSNEGGKTLADQMLPPIIDMLDPKNDRLRSQKIQIPDGRGGELTVSRQIEGNSLFVRWFVERRSSRNVLLATGIIAPPKAAQATAKLAALNQKVLGRSWGTRFDPDVFTGAYGNRNTPYAVLFELNAAEWYLPAIDASFTLLVAVHYRRRRFLADGLTNIGKRLKDCRSEIVEWSLHCCSAGYRVPAAHMETSIVRLADWSRPMMGDPASKRKLLN